MTRRDLLKYGSLAFLPKLEFPLARRFTVDLKQAETIVEVPVRARTSGSFAMKVEFHTPDGLVEVGAPARVQIRSLAVSGLGLVLSISALVFLAFWWFKDWRRRRNQRIDNVRGHHPAGATT